MFQLCLHRPGTSVCSCSIFAPKAEISPKLATHEGLLMHCMSSIFMLFLYWLSELQRLNFSCSFRASSCTSVHYCARTHAALQINFVWAGIDITYAGDSTALHDPWQSFVTLLGECSALWGERE